jgi:hypothetical protein
MRQYKSATAAFTATSAKPRGRALAAKIAAKLF